MKKMTKIKLLTLCIGLVQQSYAMEQISDDSLSTVTGQDGMYIEHTITGASVNALNWVDYSDNDRKSKVSFDDVKIFGINSDIQSTLWNDMQSVDDMNDVNQIIRPTNMKTTIKLDIGGAGQQQNAGILLSANVSPFHASIKNIFLLCEQSWCATPSQSLGGLSITAASDIGFVLQTTNGLFNKNELAYLDLNIQNVSISHVLGRNALTLKDMNFNLVGRGYMYISPEEGVVLESRDQNILLERVADLNDVHSSRSGENATNPGVNIDLRYGQDPNNQKNIMRMGASGTITNARLAFSGDQSGLSKFGANASESAAYKGNQLHQNNGYQSDNSGGLHLKMSAEFTRGIDKETKLEIGHTGNGSYALEFSNLSPLAVRDAQGNLNTQKAYIDFGDIYINSIQAKSLNFYVSDKIKNILGEGARINGNIYTQVLSDQYSPSAEAEYLKTLTAAGREAAQVGSWNNKNAALIAIRGFDFQSIARQAKFISDNSIAKLSDQNSTWGIGIPIYNLNANIALSEYKSGTKTGLAYNLTASTQGYGVENGQPKTTSLLIIDGKTGTYSGEEVNYYAGFRNIDAFVDTKGTITYEDDGILISADRLLIAANAELAIGQLPGSRYDCNGCTGYVPLNSFARQDDVITTIALKLDGKGDLMIIPGVNASNATPETNFLSLRGNFEFTELTTEQKNNPNYLGSYLSLINKEVDINDSTGESVVGQSSINFNKLQGALAAEGRVHVKKDMVVFDNQVKFNPKNNNKHFQGEVALSYTGHGVNPEMQKIMNFAIPGGTMRSNLGIKPH